MAKCGYCGGLGYVSWLGMTGRMLCRYCGGSGEVPEDLREEAAREGDKRRAEPIILLLLTAGFLLFFFLYELICFAVKFGKSLA